MSPNTCARSDHVEPYCVARTEAPPALPAGRYLSRGGRLFAAELDRLSSRRLPGAGQGRGAGRRRRRRGAQRHRSRRRPEARRGRAVAAGFRRIRRRRRHRRRDRAGAAARKPRRRARKIQGEELAGEDIGAIIADIAAMRYSKMEIAAFLIASASFLSTNEVLEMTRAMARVGGQLKWPGDFVVDKHCIGGIPGNRTSMIVVPIVAAHGLMIPKTSSRAITSPAGTADTMEVLARVDLGIEQMQEVVRHEKGCLIWGGHVNLCRRRHPDIGRAAAGDRHAREDGRLDPLEEARGRVLAPRHRPAGRADGEGPHAQRSHPAAQALRICWRPAGSRARGDDHRRRAAPRARRRSRARSARRDEGAPSRAECPSRSARPGNPPGRANPRVRSRAARRRRGSARAFPSSTPARPSPRWSASSTPRAAAQRPARWVR